MIDGRSADGTDIMIRGLFLSGPRVALPWPFFVSLGAGLLAAGLLLIWLTSDAPLAWVGVLEGATVAAVGAGFLALGADRRMRAPRRR
jgi:hypothetical protein